MIQVADLTDGGTAVDVYLTQFAGRHTQQGIAAFFGHQLDGSTGAPAHLAAFADLQFHIVDHGTQRDVLQGQCVAHFDIGFGTADNNVAHLQALRSQDVAFFTVCIVQQSNVGAPVGIIFDGRNFCGDVVFIPFEIDDTILSFVTAALMTNRHFTGVVPAGMLVQFNN